MIKRPWLRYIMITSLKLGLALAFVIVGYLIYLDASLSRVFASERYQAPALVYASETRLFPGKHISKQQLIEQLERLSYQRSSSTEETGYYSHANNLVMVHRRPFEFADGAQMSKRVEVRFDGAQIQSIREWPSGVALRELRLEPQLIGRINPLDNEDRLLVGLEVVPNLLIETLLLVEDRNFYHHSGVSPWSVMRALVANIKAGRTVQGGSTLTQQLVKNLYLTREQTLWRKFHEAMMALVIDYRFDKNTILETYLNEVYFGQDGRHAIHGVGLASQYYFGRQIQELTPAQTALMVAMIKGPSYYDPRRYTERTKQRRDTILRMMYENDLVAKDSYIAAVEAPIEVRESRRLVEESYPHYLDLIRRELGEIVLPPEWHEVGLKIYTAMDVDLQSTAQKVLRNGIPGRAIDGLQGAVVISDYRSGHIRAMVGSTNNDGQGYNRALMALRPIGSLMKPVIYASAMSVADGMHLGSRVVDEAVILEDEHGKRWQPENYDKTYLGDMLMYQALVKSRNIPAVRIGLEVGTRTLANYLKAMGVTTPINDYPSLTLGAVELSPLAVNRIYSTIANDGRYQPLKAITSITTHDGLSVYESHVAEPKAVYTPAVSYMIRYGMAGVVSLGTATALQDTLGGATVAGKTGTTNDYKDSWFVSIDGEHVITTWLGRDDNSPTGLTGSSGALMINREIYRQAPPQPMSLRPQGDVRLQSFHATKGVRIPSQCPQAVTVPAPPIPLNDDINCDADVDEKSWLERLFGG
ncbi:penicillin-binding protein 1B [Idiomarina aquatica]|uniref:Penicillin-binding protein 1B n=1 Tax=Idiomarina aquatica TaxID=1327752 RepID=A0AA94EDU9_9GAMM|nr:penicillin-binding protein 1B [Idiomarina aquatica]RUO42373.1 penicillin-binding protein 1B [Idiomarina aquatica]